MGNKVSLSQLPKKGRKSQLPKEEPNSQLPKWTHWGKLIMEVILVIGAIAGIFLTLLTLLEIKQQRIKTYEPELRIINTPFKMTCKIRTYDSMAIHFTLLTYNSKFDSSVLKYPEDIMTHEKIKDWETFELANLFSIPIFNVGHGVAFDVKVKFVIDTTYFLEFMNKYKAIVGNIDTVFVQQGSFVFPFGTDTTILYNIEPTQNKQFIPPFSETSDTFNITIPSNYFKLVSYWELTIYKYLSFMDLLPKKYPELYQMYISRSRPPITVILEYRDANELGYARKFKCYYKHKPYLRFVPMDKVTVDGEMVSEFIPLE